MTTKRVASGPKSTRKRRKATNAAAEQLAETRAQVRAHTSLRPAVQAAATMIVFDEDYGERSANTLVNDLETQCRLVHGGDLRRVEAILIAQAHTLDAIFHKHVRRAAHADYLSQLDTDMRIALKAQAQCRSTVEAVVAIKNPKSVAFV